MFCFFDNYVRDSILFFKLAECFDTVWEVGDVFQVIIIFQDVLNATIANRTECMKTVFFEKKIENPQKASYTYILTELHTEFQLQHKFDPILPRCSELEFRRFYLLSGRNYLAERRRRGVLCVSMWFFPDRVTFTLKNISKKFERLHYKC